MKKCPRCKTENPEHQVICKGTGCVHVFRTDGPESLPPPFLIRTYPVGIVYEGR
jgi:hypothetical protein